MRTPARIKDHPVHPMLIPFPFALWGFSFAADLMYLASGRKKKWRSIAGTTMGSGVLSALVAAVPGFIDYLSIKDPQVQKIATTHMLLNLGGVASYSLNYGLRKRRKNINLPIVLSAASMVVLGISGWLGGTMVYKHRVGVAEEQLPEVTGREARHIQSSPP